MTIYNASYGIGLGKTPILPNLPTKPLSFITHLTPYLLPYLPPVRVQPSNQPTVSSSLQPPHPSPHVSLLNPSQQWSCDTSSRSLVYIPTFLVGMLSTLGSGSMFLFLFFAGVGGGSCGGVGGNPNSSMIGSCVY